jgi:hypothetical protein
MGVSGGSSIASWGEPIVEARIQIDSLLEGSPSLHTYPDSVLAKAYADGLREAAVETGLADLAESCPWTIEQVRSHEFMPD